MARVNAAGNTTRSVSPIVTSAGEPRSSREAILDQAATCFALAGYRGTSMRDIATASNMMAGSLYSHFTSKLQILQELMDSYFAELLPRQRAVVAGNGTTLQRLHDFIAAEVAAAHARPEIAMVLCLDWHVIVTTPELADVVRNASESQRLLIQLIEEGVRNGELRKDVNAEAVSRMILIAVTGLVDRRYLIPSDVGGNGTDFSAEEILRSVSSLLLNGVAGTPAPRARSRSAPKKAVKRR